MITTDQITFLIVYCNDRIKSFKNTIKKLLAAIVCFLVNVVNVSKNTIASTVVPRLSTIIPSSLLVENRFVRELKHFFPNETMVSILIRFTQKKNTQSIEKTCI